jgi:hypothetical protein
MPRKSVACAAEKSQLAAILVENETSERRVSPAAGPTVKALLSSATTLWYAAYSEVVVDENWSNASTTSFARRAQAARVLGEMGCGVGLGVGCLVVGLPAVVGLGTGVGSGVGDGVVGLDKCVGLGVVGAAVGDVSKAVGDVGAAAGALLGHEVGCDVGAADGAFVGVVDASVGDVGAAVGDVGAAVGDVGAAVGDVGATVGAAVGALLGHDVGCDVGAADGAFVGVVGASVGDVGAAVGDVGAAVGEVGAAVGEVGAAVGDLGATVGAAVGALVGGDTQLSGVSEPQPPIRLIIHMPVCVGLVVV